METMNRQIVDGQHIKSKQIIAEKEDGESVPSSEKIIYVLLDILCRFMLCFLGLIVELRSIVGHGSIVSFNLPGMAATYARRIFF